MAWNDAMGWGGDPWAELRRLQRDMDRLFTGMTEGGDTFPAVNVWSDRDEIVVTAELPGMDPKSVDVSVHGDQLAIQGERAAEPETEEVVCYRQERWSGRFARTFRLPFEVERDKVKAQYKQGVLTVTLPRAAESKPRQIRIEAEG
jgi:HSP20 family protein